MRCDTWNIDEAAKSDIYIVDDDSFRKLRGSDLKRMRRECQVSKWDNDEQLYALTQTVETITEELYARTLVMWNRWIWGAMIAALVVGGLTLGAELRLSKTDDTAATKDLATNGYMASADMLPSSPAAQRTRAAFSSALPMLQSFACGCSLASSIAQPSVDSNVTP